MKIKITPRGITLGSLFKIIFVGYLGGLLPVFIYGGYLALMGDASVVSIGGQAQTGFTGLLSSLIMWPIGSAMFAVLSWICIVVGLYFYTRLSSISIHLVDMDEAGDNGSSRRVAA